MKSLKRGLTFFIGWVLSPFTWWNDAFVNIPLSYIMANLLYAATKFSFDWLLVGSYWFTNALGVYFMYLGGKGFILSSKNRRKVIFLLIAFVAIYSAVMLYLNKEGRLLPLSAYFEKYCVKK